MSLFSKQKVFCNACGKEFLTTFSEYAGVVCGSICYNELQLLKATSTLGLERKQTQELREETIKD